MPAPPPPPIDPATDDPEPDPREVARAIVLRQLTGSPKSRAQLEQVLRRRNCPDEVAASVLDRMEQVGLVDDSAYAGMLVRSQQATRGLAKRALAQQLRTKGVAKEVADMALDEVDPVVEEELARRLVDKRLQRMHGLDRQVRVRRLAAMLARKGYSSDLALRVIREAFDAEPEHLRD